MFRFEGIDLFCGAGGVTTGINRARAEGRKIAFVKAAINHDPLAIESHRKNHPSTRHFTEDIRSFYLPKLPRFVKSEDILTYLWASLECINFSNAKGGRSRDADSRTLAWDLIRYIEYFSPDYLLIENVREFLAWGPLTQKKDKTGTPVFDKDSNPVMVPESRTKGRDFIKWRDRIRSMGYEYDFRILDSANYGAHTSRKRLFIIFAKAGLPITFPAMTHSRTGGQGLKKWKAVKEVLDFSDKGRSIFERKKPLSERTYKRILAGLIKYVAQGDTSFLQQYNSGSDSCRVIDINNPANTITTCNRFGLVSADFLTKYHGNGENVLSTEEPCSTLSTKDRLALIRPEFFLDLQYSSGKLNQSVNDPSGAILPVPKQNLVRLERAWLINSRFENTGSSLDNPAPALLARGRNYYLLNPKYSSAGSSTDKPCFTLIAKMDKKPPYLVTTEQGGLAIEIKATDSPFVVKIKQFMAAYGIIDIYMRMLKIKELLKIQGFDENYILFGSQADQKKFIGNAVPPLMPKKIIEALYHANCSFEEDLFTGLAV